MTYNLIKFEAYETFFENHKITVANSSPIIVVG